MQCPACGFVLSPFDVNCPRCKHFESKGGQAPSTSQFACEQEPTKQEIPALPPPQEQPPTPVQTVHEVPASHPGVAISIALIVLFVLVFTIVCLSSSSNDSSRSSSDPEQSRSDKVAALEEGIADRLSGEVGTLTSGGKARIHNVISSCSVYIVDETENRAKVTAKFDNGVVYASGEVERDETGKWHADDTTVSTAEL